MDNKDVIVIIDEEPLTYVAFLKNGVNAEECDSKKSLGIRMTDMFVGFVGRFIYNLKSDVQEINYKRLSDIKKKDFITKRLINNNWFNLNEEEFNLIKQIAEFFNRSTHWSSFTLQYMDDIILCNIKIILSFARIKICTMNILILIHVNTCSHPTKI